MPTLKEVITDVLANPEKYEGAFPVTEPEPADYGDGSGSLAWEQLKLSEFFQQFMNEPLLRFAERMVEARIAPSSDVARRVMLSTPFSRDSIASRILDGSAFNNPRWEDYQSVPAEIRDGQVHVPSFEVSAPSPEHYRVRGGLCACGFESAFTGDMDRHIEVGPYPPPRGPLHDQVIVDEAIPTDTVVFVDSRGGMVRVDNLGSGEDS